MIILDIIGTFVLEYYSKSERVNLVNSNLPILIVVVLVFKFINDYRYKSKYDNYNEKWKNENEKQRTIGTVIITILLLIPVIYLPILLNLNDYTE